MPAAVLNNAATQDAYVDALTVVFVNPRSSFSLDISNAAIMYQLAVPGLSGRMGDLAWEMSEHYKLPTLNSFESPDKEGFPGVLQFAGVRVRSAAAATPARVSVA